MTGPTMATIAAEIEGQGTERRKLISERDFLTERLTEIGLELKRLMAEATALKTELDGVPEPIVQRRRAIRRRRSYIARRNTDLKSERESAVLERNKLIKQLLVENPQPREP